MRKSTKSLGFGASTKLVPRALYSEPESGGSEEMKDDVELAMTV